MTVRYAPSPTGDFHLGNLRTAWVSWHIARELNEPWIVRFEDIDKPRVLAGAREKQLADLKALALIPDHIVTQSERYARHRDLFERAVVAGDVYPCDCSRADVARDLEAITSASQGSIAVAPFESMASAPHAPPMSGATSSLPSVKIPVYSGHCRHNDTPRSKTETVSSIGWRLKREDPSGRDDILIARTTPDFIPAYNWACGIDDYDGGYKTLVRAWDLADVVDVQRAIGRLVAKLDTKPEHSARIFHASLILDDTGHRLEKRTGGVKLGELVAAGWGPDRLNAAFEKSFDRTAWQTFRTTNADTGGETQHERRLAEILPPG